jgi:hypothetical protein
MSIFAKKVKSVVSHNNSNQRVDPLSFVTSNFMSSSNIQRNDWGPFKKIYVCLSPPVESSKPILLYPAISKNNGLIARQLHLPNC